MDPVQSIIDAIAGLIPTRNQRFEEAVPLMFDEELARQAIAQQTARYYQPQLTDLIEQARTNMAARGLFRSGIRRQSEFDISEDIATKEREMQEQLLSSRIQQAAEARALEQQRYEDAIKLGQRYTPSKAVSDKTAYSTGDLGFKYAPLYATGRAVGGRYGLGEVEGSDRERRFGQSFSEYVKSKFPSSFLGSSSGRQRILI